MSRAFESDVSQLSKSAKRVQDELLKYGLSLRVVELSTSTRTANDAAASIGCEVAQIVKTLLFRCVETNEPVLILASGVNRVNEKSIEHRLGKKMMKADADYTRDVTGFAIGGVSPVGHQQKIDFIFIDEDLLQFETIWAAAGTPNAVFSLSPNDLQRLTGGKVVSVTGWLYKTRLI
ncbi:MAG TPA: YbaK/EbsC family protein [Gammaproteobacteria bacterium]|nr:YbaK/EbsC family protein [Gammaproteobacteria bacterium]